MTTSRSCLYIALAVTAGIAASHLMASEYRGAVKAGGTPYPGVVVTAIQGDKRIVTTTDDRGTFHFPDLPDGTWTLEVHTLGFENISREVGVAPGAPAPELDLKFLSESALTASLGVQPATPPGTPEVSGLRPNMPGMPGMGRGGQPTGGFQRMEVSQQGDARQFTSQGTMKTEEVADLSQNAANSFLVQGSMSSALGMGAQNDWGPPMGTGMGLDGGGRGGMGMGGDMAAGNNGDGPAVMAGGIGGGPGGGRGGPGGGGPGGPVGGPGGGPGGGGPGGGGPGGGGFGPGGFGGPGGRGGGPPGAPPWAGMANARAFGNSRRDPRSMYMISANFMLSNSALDARSFSVTGADLGKPAYATGRGGFMVGGPLRIPKLLSADKRIMFSFNYDFQRNRTGNTSNPVNMPTTLERTGDFSQTTSLGNAVVIYDPNTNAPFAGNVIPKTRISSTATALLQYFPNPNLPFATRNYQTALNGLNKSQNINARLSNIQLDKKDRLNFGAGFQASNNITPNQLQYKDTGEGSGLNANLAWSRNITAKVTNNLTYTFSRMRQESTPYFADRTNVAAALGIAGTSPEAVNWGPPNLSFTNYASLTDGNYSLSRNQTSSLGESLGWVHGTHNLTFGSDYRRQQFNQLADNNGRGTYSFNGSATSYLANGVAQTGTGYDLADFLLGMPTTGSLRFGNPDKYLRGSSYDTFASDDWRLASRLSFTLGLRWEYSTPVSELRNRLVNLVAAPGFTSIAAVVPGQSSPYTGVLPNALVNSDRNNFSPRFGFAWRPMKKGSLVVRGGYGLYYNSSVYNSIASNMAQQPPFADSLSVAASNTNPLNIQNAFLLASSSAGTSTYAIDPNYRVGYAQTWNVTVQHDLPFSMFGTIGYLGTKGTRLDQQFIPNSVAPGAVESLLPHNFTYETSNGNSIAHTAQFQLNRRFHSGMMWRTSYQYAKSIDNAGTGGRGQGNTPVAQNWLDLSAERGLSSFDQRHNLSLQLQYSSGMGIGGGTLINGWKGAILKDWTVSSGINVRSGNPYTATVGGNRSQVSGTAASAALRAQATGLPEAAEGELFNTAAFTTPAAGTWGNAGRNTIPGPNVFSLDGNLQRVFRLGERHSIDFQMQASNLLNHVTITNWGTVLGSSTYGLASNAAAMRKVNFNLRFRF